MRKFFITTWVITILYTISLASWMISTNSYQLAHMMCALSDILPEGRGFYQVLDVHERPALTIEKMAWSEHTPTKVTEQSRATLVFVISYHLFTYVLVFLWIFALAVTFVYFGFKKMPYQTKLHPTTA